MGRCRFALVLYGAAWLAGAGALAAWRAQAEGGGWRHALGAALLGAAGLAAWHSWRRMPSGLLAWDGAGWRWADGRGEVGGRLDVALDLQRWLLVRWREQAPPGRGRAAWLWLERQREPNAWNALRRAVYSPATTDAPPGAPPSAKQ